MARKARNIPTQVSDFVLDIAKDDRAAAMAFFLGEQGKDATGEWSGYLNAAAQRALFGTVIGKGRIWIDGAKEEVGMVVMQCYGMDCSTEVLQPWSALAAGQIVQKLPYFSNRHALPVGGFNRAEA